MTNLKNILLEKYNKYLRYKHAISRLSPFPIEGRLIVAKRKYKNQFRHSIIVDGKTKYVYLDKSSTKLRDQLAFNKYYEEINVLLQKRLSQFESILEDFSDHELDEVFEKIGLPEDSLVKPIFPTMNQKFNKWKSIKSHPRILPNAPEIYTNNGEKVYSKSEKILADRLFIHGISYKYEAPLEIENKVYYPDFTIYSKKLDKIIYWEHLGMMENSNYEERNFNKLNKFTLNGIYAGSNLIITYESSSTYLNDKVIDFYIYKYFK